MTAPLYTTEILRLAASLGTQPTLTRVDGTGDERAPTCGSRVRTQVQLDDEGRIEALTQDVQACAFGQASAALVAKEAPRRTASDAQSGLIALESWLGGEGGEAALWPGFDALAPARSRRARHPAILLPFRSLLAALKAAK